jgi:hypothetical protein
MLMNMISSRHASGSMRDIPSMRLSAFCHEQKERSCAKSSSQIVYKKTSKAEIILIKLLAYTFIAIILFYDPLA